jgi:hypothetical protein
MITKVFNRYFFFGLMIGVLGTFFPLRRYYSNLFWSTSADVRLAARCYRTLAIKFLQIGIPISQVDAEMDVDLLADRMMTALLVKEKIEYPHE